MLVSGDETPICTRPGCGKSILKRQRESYRQYRERKHCGVECAALHKREKAEERARAVAMLRESGMSTAQIAEREGISTKHISRLARAGDTVKGDERLGATKKARAVMDALPARLAAQLRCLPECEIELMRRMKGSRLDG